MFHGYHSRGPNEQATWAAAQSAHKSSPFSNQQQSEISRKYIDPAKSLSLLELLPRELFLITVENLDKVDKACLALTSHGMAGALGPNVWSDIKKCPRSQGSQFLGTVARDLSMTYWHCEGCMILHKRAFEEADTRGSVLGNMLNIKNFLTAQQSGYGRREFQIRVHGTPIYALPFSLVKAVMDRHFQGKDKGRCMNSLYCSGECTNVPQTEVGKNGLKYGLRPGIVFGELLLRATYTWEAQDWKNRLALRGDERPKAPGGRIRVEDLTENIGLMICEHLRAHTALQDAFHRPPARQIIRCKYCPTQLRVKYSTGSVMEYSTQFQVWHHLGPCQQGGEENWTHLVGGDGEWKEFDWKNWSTGEQSRAFGSLGEVYEGSTW